MGARKNSDELIKEKCRLFLDLMKVFLPADIYNQVYCHDCGYLSLLWCRSKKQRTGLLKCIKVNECVCSTCNGRNLLYCGSQEGRRKLVEEFTADR